MFLATILQAKYEPFEHQLLNKFELLSLFVSSITFFLGVLTRDEQDHFRGASMVALALNVLYILLAIPLALHLKNEGKIQKEIDLRLKKLENGENAPMLGKLESAESQPDTFQEQIGQTNPVSLTNLGLLTEEPAVNVESDHSINQISPSKKQSLFDRLNLASAHEKGKKMVTKRIKHVRSFSLDM